MQLIRLLQTTGRLSQHCYSEEQRQQLASWSQHWSAEDQKIASQRWEAALAELQRLVAAQANPADPPAQALAREWYDLIQSFTHGDPGREHGIASMYREIASMPAEARPLSLPCDETGGNFIRQAVTIERATQAR